jgi:hypothetical protein
MFSVSLPINPSRFLSPDRPFFAADTSARRMRFHDGELDTLLRISAPDQNGKFFLIFQSVSGMEWGTSVVSQCSVPFSALSVLHVYRQFWL